MGSSKFPLGEQESSALNEQDFIDWLSAIMVPSDDVVNVLANDIARHRQSVRAGEAAALLRAVDRLAPAPGTILDQNVAFAVVGTVQPEEHLLANAIASGLQLTVTQDIFPGSRITSSIPRAAPFLLEAQQRSSHFEGWGPNARNTRNALYLHDSSSLRNKLIEAIHLSATEEQVWQAVSILLEIPLRSKDRYAVIDIKVGDHLPAFSYDQGMSLARHLLKIAWLADIQCRVILSDAVASTSLAFGPQAELQDLVRALNGDHAPPYTSVAIELVAGALALITPGTYARDSASRAREALNTGAARSAALAWNLPTLTAALTQGGYEGEQHRVPSIASGYLQRVNNPLVRAALAAANRLKGEEYSALILCNVGEFVNAGEDLVQVLGGSSVEVADRLASTVRSSCDLGVKQPQLVAAVRVHIILETVLVRRQIAVVAPIKKKDTGGTQVFVLRSPGSSTIDLASVPYDGTSRSSDITQAASQLAAQMFLPGGGLEIKKETQVKSESFTYDPVNDVLLSPRYQVFSVSVARGMSDLYAGEITGVPGEWISLEDIQTLDNEKLGPVLRTVKSAIRDLAE